MPFVESDGIRFHYALSDTEGPLVVFQHGLGGDLSQPQAILGGSALLRTLSFDCRGHGCTEPLGPLERLTFSAFADDLRAVLDSLGFDRAIIGGISMGAGVALNFAIRHPARVTALILSRPAWLDAAYPPNLKILVSICRNLKEGGPEYTRKRLVADPEFERIQSISRDNAASVLRQLERPNLDAMIALLERLPGDAPSPTVEAWRQVRVPTLLLVNAMDALHPIEYGERLAREIPGAKLVEVTPKEVDPVSHGRDALKAIEDFVTTTSFESGKL